MRGMVRVIVPPETVVAGVNMRTGFTAEPAPLYAMVTEVNATAVTMAGAGSCLVPKSLDVDNVNTPAA